MTHDTLSHSATSSLPAAYQRLIASEQSLLEELRLVDQADADSLQAEMDRLQLSEQAQFGFGAVAVSLAIQRNGTDDHEQGRQLNHLEKLAESLESIALLRVSRQLLGKQPQDFHEQTARSKIIDYATEFSNRPEHVALLERLAAADAGA